jgi:hypothetical protein
MAIFDQQNLNVFFNLNFLSFGHPKPVSGSRPHPDSRKACAGIFTQSIGARNRVGIGLSYRPAWLHSLEELVPRNRFLGSLKV